MTSAFFYNIIYLAVETSGDILGENDMFLFGDVIGLRDSSSDYSLLEVFFFIGIGIIGGVFGALKRSNVWKTFRSVLSEQKRTDL